MDWHPIPFEPNLQFALELKEDLKEKYLQKHEKAKVSLENFFQSLQNVLREHQKVLTENIELSITNEKLKKTIDIQEIKPLERLYTDTQTSKIRESNSNYKFVTNTLKNKKKLENKSSNEDFICNDKENINDLVPIFSSDFNSDIEDECFEVKNISPPTSVTSTPLKVQCSPIISKRNKLSIKKGNLSLSNNSHSTTSSNDSKLNSIKDVCPLEKNIIDIDFESDKECSKTPRKEPLKTIENIPLSVTLSAQETNTNLNILSVSKTSFGKAEFTEQGKRLRQTTLTLKKITPVIDLSKIDCNESICNKNTTDTETNATWNETFYTSKFDGQNLNENKKKNDEIKSKNKSDKSLKIINNTKNQMNKTNQELQNISSKDDELIETSPAQSETSKLRNKFSLNKIFESNKIKVPSKTNVKQIPKLKCQNKSCNKEEKCEFEKTSNKTKLETTNSNKKRKSYNHQTFDETYFSPAELGTNKNDLDYDTDITQFENETKSDSPPTKRALLDSFDEVPDKKEKSPDFAYKETVRRKEEKAQLPGWDCRECEKWYGHLPEKERKKRQNQCSKHRGKYKADILTPESFWNPVFDDSLDSSSFGDN